MENFGMIISTQEQLDKSKIIKDDKTVYIRSKNNLILNDNGYFVVQGDSHVVVLGDSRVEARDNSRVEARDNSRVVACENSHVEAWDTSHVEAWDTSRVDARDSSSIDAWDNSSIVAGDNSHVEAGDNSSVRINAKITLSLNGFAVLFKPTELKFKFKKSNTSLVQDYPSQDLSVNGIKKNKNIILYKRVTQDYKTNEGNETTWKIGSTVTHPNECRGGKFHACSKPYFCDEFHFDSGDKYIALEVALKDTYVWTNNPYFPNKIAFKRAKVLYEVNEYGDKLEG